MDRNEMEMEIEAGGFLEHGLYGEHLYGTKFDSVRRIIQSSKMCVLDVEPTVRRKK
jgi:guanylate kinase